MSSEKEVMTNIILHEAYCSKNFMRNKIDKEVPIATIPCEFCDAKIIPEEYLLHIETHHNRNKIVKKPKVLSKPPTGSSSLIEYEGKGEQKDCRICFLEYEIGEELALLDCAHKFHAECFKKWYSKKPVCPLCQHKTSK